MLHNDSVVNFVQIFRWPGINQHGWYFEFSIVFTEKARKGAHAIGERATDKRNYLIVKESW
jgi:hypothetical protein